MMPSQAQEDATHWNARYSAGPRDWFKSPRSIVVNNLHYFPASGLALDAATGAGANADFLINHGIQVIGVDISITALNRAGLRNQQIQRVLADLRHIPFPANTFDIILNLYFLDRPLCSEYINLLKPGGLIVFETLTQAMLDRYPDKNPAHLLRTGELPKLFQNFKILYYNEGWIQSDHDEQKAVASLVAVRP